MIQTKINYLKHLKKQSVQKNTEGYKFYQLQRLNHNWFKVNGRDEATLPSEGLFDPSADVLPIHILPYGAFTTPEPGKLAYYIQNYGPLTQVKVKETGERSLAEDPGVNPFMFEDLSTLSKRYWYYPMGDRVLFGSPWRLSGFLNVKRQPVVNYWVYVPPEEFSSYKPNPTFLGSTEEEEETFFRGLIRNFIADLREFAKNDEVPGQPMWKEGASTAVYSSSFKKTPRSLKIILTYTMDRVGYYDFWYEEIERIMPQPIGSLGLNELITYVAQTMA